MADAGADLIVGSHPHMVQRFSYIGAADGRLGSLRVFAREFPHHNVGAQRKPRQRNTPRGTHPR